jgi:hypothetical protein
MTVLFVKSEIQSTDSSCFVHQNQDRHFKRHVAYPRLGCGDEHLLNVI